MTYPPGENKTDCYSAGERRSMEWTQQLRGRWLAPVLRGLTQAGITADMITLWSLLLGLLFCAAYPWRPAIGLWLLGVHVLLDGLDGPLARHQGAASRAGSFTDTFCDQIVISASTITLMALPEPRIGVVPGGLYLVLYALVVALAMVRNALAIPYSWVLRPRFYVYAWLIGETYLFPGTLDYLIWGCDAVLAVKLLSGFFKVKRALI